MDGRHGPGLSDNFLDRRLLCDRLARSVAANVSCDDPWLDRSRIKYSSGDRAYTDGSRPGVVSDRISPKCITLRMDRRKVATDPDGVATESGNQILIPHEPFSTQIEYVQIHLNSFRSDHRFFDYYFWAIDGRAESKSSFRDVGR